MHVDHPKQTHAGDLLHHNGGCSHDLPEAVWLDVSVTLQLLKKLLANMVVWVILLLVAVTWRLSRGACE